MNTHLPEAVRETLTSIGQAAAELSCQVEGYREFVTVFRFQTTRIPGFQFQFPYLDKLDTAYRLMRFQIDANLLRDGRDLSSKDLVGLQSIHVATEQDVLAILNLWEVLPDALRQPRETEVPV